MIICLETATNLCSVALCSDAGLISLRESTEPKSHASYAYSVYFRNAKRAGIACKRS